VERIAELLNNFPETLVRLTGHADAIGSADYNLLLSNQRALKIAEYLEMRGVDRSRISIEGKGELAPIARNTYPDGSDAPLGRYLNRQVTVTVISPDPIQAELAGFYVPASLKTSAGDFSGESSEYWFTVQVRAKLSPMDISGFRGIGEVKETVCKDGYYRYTHGAFRTFEEARSSLEKIKAAGYPDAFIQTLEWYSKACR
jgi:hypothetical protein